MNQNKKLDHGIEITLKTPDSFSIIKETLTRIGIASKKNKTLYQSVHILHKRGDYYLMHFIELFSLDGKPTNIEEEDYRRRNAIAKLLVNWGLCKVVRTEEINLVDPETDIMVIPYKEKKDWNLVSKYTVGNKK